MRTIERIFAIAVLVVTLLGSLAQPVPTRAAPIGDPAFLRTWQRTDQPVAERQVLRTWMWGPDAGVEPVYEAYTDAPGGQRLVQYFDKSRMEITHPGGDPNSLWYVTNGLLVRELITGQLQTGDASFEMHAPAQINVAGDQDDTKAPTYATFKPFINTQPLPDGWVITQTVDRIGSIGTDWNLARYNVTASTYATPTNHRVASVFWEFMLSGGLVYEQGQLGEAALFENPYYATGYPLAEPYWTTVKVGGVPKQVLIQVFERRVLTYTPDNPAGWRVEAGNVGQHYYSWRYGYRSFDSTQPVWIRGLTRDAVMRHVRSQGYSCEIKGNESFNCEIASLKVYYNGIVTADEEERVKSINIWFVNYGPSSTDRIAAEILGHIAAIPYADASPQSTTAEVVARIGEDITFAVGSATFTLNKGLQPGSPQWTTSRVLWIVATGRR